MDKMVGAIIEYCDARDREQWPIAEGYEAEASKVQPVAKPPRIKIRGKNWRGSSPTPASVEASPAKQHPSSTPPGPSPSSS